MEAMLHANHLARLDRRLQSLLDAELAAGNEIASTMEWPYSYAEILVCVRSPFRVVPEKLPIGVQFEQNPDHLIGCPFDYSCKVSTPAGADPDRDYWHILRGPRTVL